MVWPIWGFRCELKPFTGEQFADAIKLWVEHGHIVDESESDEGVNETAVLDSFTDGHDNWFDGECAKLKRKVQSEITGEVKKLIAASGQDDCSQNRPPPHVVTLLVTWPLLLYHLLLATICNPRRGGGMARKAPPRSPSELNPELEFVGACR